jgi:hypothetical protein
MGLFNASTSGDASSIQTTDGKKTSNTEFSKDIKDLITSASTEGKTAYTAPWETFKSADYVAPANIAQNSYWTNTQNLQSPDAFDKSKTAYTGVGDSTFDQAQAQQYMSPYQDAVTQATMAELKRQYDEQRGQLGLEKVLGGGINSSGYALALAKAGQNYGNTAASTYAKLQQAAYENAQKQYNDEQNRRIQAAQGLATLGSNISSSDLARLQAQGLAATDEYSLAKAAKDFELEEARTAREQPTKNASNYASFIAALPREQFQTAETDDTTTVYGTDPSILSDIFSTSGGVMGLLNMNKQLKEGGGKGLWDTFKDLFS